MYTVDFLKHGGVMLMRCGGSDGEWQLKHNTVLL